MKINRFIALALIALLVVSAMGVITYRTLAQTPSTDSESADDGGAEDGDNAVLQGEAVLTAEEAAAIVQAKYPDANIVETELENESGTLVWSVELDNGYEAEVDAQDGTILSESGEEADGD